jgi:hypothetical protein
MSVAISYIVQNTNNEYEEAGLGTLDPLTTLEGIYGNRDWSFELAFGGTDSTQGDPISVTSIVATTPTYVINSNVANNVVSMSKNPAELIFPGEGYRFVTFGSTEETTYTDLSELPEGLNVVGWDTPPTKRLTATYTFDIMYDVPNQSLLGQTATVTLAQDFFWDFVSGAAKLQQQVSNSEY